jgi:hypothetical protein
MMAMRRIVAAITVGVMAGFNPLSVAAQQTQAPVVQNQQPDQSQMQQTGEGTYVMKVNSNIVLTNVVVRDKKTGEVVKGLKASDFQIIEDKKPQKISSFDYENVDIAATLAEGKTTIGKASISDLLERNFAANTEQLRDHRLIVFRP